MKRLVIIGLVLAVAILASGCASYTTKFVNTAQVDNNKLVKDNSNDILVVAFPILTEKDSKDYFDENLIRKGVLAVYLNILNIASGDINLVNSTLSVQSGNKEFAPLPVEKVYGYIKRGYGARAIFWLSITYGVGGPVSAALTKSTNNKIEEDLQAKMLKLGNIKSKESIQGFLWFKLSDDAMSEQNAKLALKLTFEQNGKSIVKDLSFLVPKAD